MISSWAATQGYSYGGLAVNTLIVYDSIFGNTQQIAEAIAERVEQKGFVREVKAYQLSPAELEGIGLMVMGCPTHRLNIPKASRVVLEGTPVRALRGVGTAAFDTRYRMPAWKSGSAARTLSRKLHRLGGKQVVPPESFFIVARKGPLGEGEVERAKRWAESILGRLKRREPEIVHKAA